MFEEGNRLRAEYGADAVFDLSLGNPVMEPPAEFKHALLEVAADPSPGLHRYMENRGYRFAREAVASMLNGGRDGGGEAEWFDADRVVMCCGAAAGINVALHALVEPGDEVVFFSPYFPEYPFYVLNAHGVPKVVRTRPDADFALEVAALEAAVGPKTRALILNTPANPTGRVWPQADLEALAAVLRERAPRCVIVADEPYRRILFDGFTHHCISQFYPKSLLVGSFSKDLGIPGERLGYMAMGPGWPAGEHAELMAAFGFLTRTLGYVNAPAFMQRVLPHVIDHPIDAGCYQRRRDMLVPALRGMGLEVAEPGGAFYVFPKSPVEDDVAFAQALAAERVLVVPGVGFGQPGYFRLSYCVDMRVLEGALPAMAAVVARAG